MLDLGTFMVNDPRFEYNNSDEDQRALARNDKCKQFNQRLFATLLEISNGDPNQLKFLIDHAGLLSNKDREDESAYTKETLDAILDLYINHIPTREELFKKYSDILGEKIGPDEDEVKADADKEADDAPIESSSDDSDDEEISLEDDSAEDDEEAKELIAKSQQVNAAKAAAAKDPNKQKKKIADFGAKLGF